MEDDEDRREPGFEDQRDLLGAAPREFAIEGFLVEQGVVVLWGLPGANKSLLLLSWLSACAYGADYNGKPAKRGLAVYLCWDGYRWLTGQRREAWRRYYRYEAVEIDGMKCQHYADLADRDASLRNIDLFSPAGRERLAKMIEADAAAYGGPVLVGLDTGTSMVAAMRRKDSGQAWLELTLALRWLSNRLHCCVCIVLHAQKSGDSPRGAVGPLMADCDAELKAIARDNDQCEVEVLKQRGGPGGFSYLFDVVPVDLPSRAQPVIVLRGRADAEVRRPTKPSEVAAAERDSAWLMRLARGMEDGERSPPSPVLMRAWGGDGGNQLARMRRIVPLDRGLTIHVPEEGVMKTIMLVIEDSQELLCCTARPEIVGGTPRTVRPLHPHDDTPEDVVPEDHADGDDLPVPSGHMTPREARWFLHFQHAFSASLPDERRYAILIGNPRFPRFTQDREAGIRCLHDAVANSDNATVRERARLALGKLGIEVPPPRPEPVAPAPDPEPPPEPDTPAPDPEPLPEPEPEPDKPAPDPEPPPEPEPVGPTKPRMTMHDIMEYPLPAGPDRIGAFFGAVKHGDLIENGERVIEWIRKLIAADPVRTGELFKRDTVRSILDGAKHMMQEVSTAAKPIPERPLPEPQPATETETPKNRRGWPKGKPRGPRTPKAS